jgi:predicted metalloprotease with PDZ domain
VQSLRPVSVLILVLASTASLCQCTFPASSTPVLLKYAFEPVLTKDKMALRVTLEFDGGPRGKVKLDLPSEWAGQLHVENSVTELRVLTPGTSLTDTKSPSEKELQFPPNTLIRLAYVLVKDWDGPLNSRTRFRADLSPDYFHIVGTTSLVHPELDGLQVVDVQFDWQKLPRAWSLATSFGTDDRCQSFHGTWQKAVNSLFVGGDYRIYHTTISGNALNFAIRGKWSFTDDEWTSQVRKIMEFERAFWHDNDFPYFLVTLTPFGQDHGSNGGTALTNSFMVHLSRLDTFAGNTLGDIAHETFHGWNPGKIGYLPGSDYTVSWFFEGFTKYYQDVMLFRSGLMSFPEYVAATNKRLDEYELNEGTDIPLLEFIQLHSADRSVLDQLDQRRGAVLATWLDATIRREAANRSSLDNLMFDLVAQNMAYERRHHGQPMALDNQRIFRAASRYIHRASRKQLRRYVEYGGSIRVPETALGPCVQSHVEVSPKYDLGFDRRSMRGDDKKVFGVEPGSEAFKAGLRDGQNLAGWSFNSGDASKQVRLTISGEDGKRTLAYYPRGPGVSAQQFNLDNARFSSSAGTCISGIAAAIDPGTNSE